MKKYILLVFLFGSVQAIAQHPVAPLNADTVPLLSEIVIKGFESDRRLLETPVSAGIISRSDIQQFSPASLVPAINLVPGARMEERSPGSYRLSVRGSLLRSPFGVRNIKVYWNDIPFTDAGGNSYFNLIDQHSINRIDIMKGPGGSMYGANTGGVIILHPDELP
ncbi:MAG: Plug domain-containing protein, partial [Chitinophagaceae bacterium]|nr:Plug domain-containing protein [Chitinophagaceae bacterium]